MMKPSRLKLTAVSIRKVTIHTDRKSTRLNSSHSQISYAVFCLKKKKKDHVQPSAGHRDQSRDQLHPADGQRTRQADRASDQLLWQRPGTRIVVFEHAEPHRFRT